MIRTLLKPFSFLPAILLMIMIYTFSSQTGDVSSDLSMKVSRKIIQTADYIFDANLSEEQVDHYAEKINFITRKLAHMTEYFALAIAVAFPLYVYGLHGILLMLTAGLFCVAFAGGDEFHQSMVAGRSPAVRDVAIDSFGVFWGIIAVRIVGWTGRMTIFRPRRKAPPERYEDTYDAYRYDENVTPRAHTPTSPQDMSSRYHNDVYPHQEQAAPPPKKREKDWFFDL